MKRALLAVAIALALAAPAVAGPGYHRHLADDSADVARDAPGDMSALAAPISVTRQAGCVTDFLEHNFSSRGGKGVRLLVLHYTVSANREGWGDVDAIHSFFNRPSVEASSNFIVDFEGHCKYAVNESAKAWTQGFFNPWSISIEFIATGKETRAQWLASAGLRKGALIFAAAAKRHGIPIRFVDPAGCTAPKGITDHNSLECDNTHFDVRPNFPYGRFMKLVRQTAAPPPIVFRLVDDRKTIRQSRPVAPGGAAEVRRYRFFYDRIRDDVHARLRADGAVQIVRREVP